MVPKMRLKKETPSNNEAVPNQVNQEAKPIRPGVFDGLMKMAEKADSQQDVDEAPLEYPKPEEGLFR